MEALTTVTPGGRPARIGPYTVLHELARGGMAQVFVAQRDGGKDVCVVKRLLAALELQDAAVRRFHREAHLASALDHPNIARVTDAGFEDGALYIAMEYIAGQTVDHLLEVMMRERRPFSQEEALAVILSVLDGLEYAHEARTPEGGALNLVHRDLSPRNVMVTYGGDVKIIDFGVARAEVDDFKTRPGILIGTIQYFSPEQAAGQRVDHRSDLYTVSVLLHELLAGVYMVTAPAPADMLRQIQKDDPPLLSSMNPDVSAALERVVHKGLAKSRDARWQSARELKRALAEAGGDDPRRRHAILRGLMLSLFPNGDARMAQVVKNARLRILGENHPTIEDKTRTAVTLDRETEPVEESVTVPRERPTELSTRASTLLEKTAPGRHEEPPLDDTFVRKTAVGVRISGAVERRLMSPPMLLAMLSLAAATAIVVYAVMPEDAAPVPIEDVVSTPPNAVPNADPRASARAGEPEAPAPPQEPSQPERPRHVTKAGRAHTAAPEAEKVQPADPARAALLKKIARLRAEPDGDLFQEVYDAMSGRAKALAPADKRRIQSGLDAALRANSVDGLEAAARELFKLEAPGG